MEEYTIINTGYDHRLPKYIREGRIYGDSGLNIGFSHAAEWRKERKDIEDRDDYVNISKSECDKLRKEFPRLNKMMESKNDEFVMLIGRYDYYEIEPIVSQYCGLYVPAEEDYEDYL